MNNMKPDVNLITISDNQNLIKEFLYEVIYTQRNVMQKWAKITNQTPNLKIGYPGQHLASLITGVKGTGTGARGDDLADKSEVKSCSRVDQVDKCKDCKGNVLRSQKICPNCNSTNIERKNDSKWLIAIRSEDELDMYLNKIPRMVFILSDYPEFNEGNFDKIQFTAYEIWNQSDRAVNFRLLLQDYYENIYLTKLKNIATTKGSIAPIDFWPYSFNFYMTNPIKTFHATIDYSKPKENAIDIDFYVEPNADRSKLESETMPSSLLKQDEREILSLAKDSNQEITEEQRNKLSLREMKGLTMKNKYHRFR